MNREINLYLWFKAFVSTTKQKKSTTKQQGTFNQHDGLYPSRQELYMYPATVRSLKVNCKRKNIGVAPAIVCRKQEQCRLEALQRC